ncbi:MAG: phage portal protein family protein [Candidatus Sumerlaeaceae bacterium]
MSDRIYPIEHEFQRATSAAWLSSADLAYQAIVANESFARGSEGIYGVFAELERRDAHLFATLQTRKNALLGQPWQLVWPEDSRGANAPQRNLIVQRVESVLNAVPDFTGALYHLLDALSKGYAVLEVVWKVDPHTGHVAIAKLAPRQAWEFAFDTRGGLFQLHQGWTAGPERPTQGQAPSPELIPRPGEMSLRARRCKRMPERKFIVLVSQPEPAAAYGTPLAARVYWYSWFKRQALDDWTLYNSRYGAPTPLARYAATAAPEEIERLAEALERLREHAGIIVPESVSVELLESRRTATGASPFRELADWCNDKISKVVLGQTLTTSEGRRSGSLALGRVHEAVRHDYLAADARALAEVLSRQLVRWIVDFNFGTESPAPLFAFDVEEPFDSQAELEVDRGLVQLGVPLGLDYFYRKYRRPIPSASTRKLKYDDANFYQYHLQYGVLTINEVREALGLPRVPWGDRPPVKQSPNESAEADATAQKEPNLDPLEGHRDTLPR